MSLHISNFFKKQSVRSSHNKPFTVNYFIQRFVEKTKIFLNETSVNQKFNLAVLNASSALGSIRKQIHSVPRIRVI